ncbi:endonuclease III [Candidatus Desulfovibrio trichonymphae]|uniref:Endonuclease III n=1 Tax=Candidatus Desulfovibrio trichonymphae TaxID=1725232 RepID=A0A1J1DQQ2_9BACT|nr:endonuclease III [Candidatus Desulfovibrio trichonymphae]BAV92169.1 endonuclease III [Candidatus Desulfovibrio trichonymphae]GHU98857.1 endonuclease III [Deltaproteobacteria bacterium]
MIAEHTRRVACAQKILMVLAARYPRHAPQLAARNAWELLVATVLAAQCTDTRVNTITPELFRRWPGPQELATADQTELESVIRSAGFYHSKAKNLLGAAVRVRDVFDGRVPDSLENLTSLPGVARKTANVVLFGAYGRNEGLAVDTHVKRIAYRLGLTDQTDPDRVEQDLIVLFPRREWGNVNHRMVLFGRDICHARYPCCNECEMNVFCPRRACPPSSGRNKPGRGEQPRKTSRRVS